LHFGFYESPARLRLKARALGFDLEALEKAGVLHLAWPRKPRPRQVLPTPAGPMARVTEPTGRPPSINASR
ncbi:hypothetical protein R0G64_32165, partial [Pseudomonas otitidis]|nr:hypothetical protein [Pseudomonas otitidis]